MDATHIKVNIKVTWIASSRETSLRCYRSTVPLLFLLFLLLLCYYILFARIKKLILCQQKNSPFGFTRFLTEKTNSSNSRRRSIYSSLSASFVDIGGVIFTEMVLSFTAFGGMILWGHLTGRR